LKPEAIIQNSAGALIGYNNLLTTTATSGAEVALIPNTWERYSMPNGSQTLKYQMASKAKINYIAIAAHDLANETVELSTAPTIGGSMAVVGAIDTKNNNAVMITFDEVAATEIQLKWNSSAAHELGIVYAGNYLQMQQPIYGGHSPINLSADTKYQSVVSESGQFLGRNITKRGIKSQYSWQLLDPEWYRDNFQPFVESARSLPFFLMWRPDRYRSETVFGYSVDDITPSNMSGGHGRMSVSLNMRGHSDI